MTTSIKITNPDPLTTGGEQTLSITVETKGTEYLYLIIPVGDGTTDLMTREEFTRVRSNWKIAKADGAASEKPDAELSEPKLEDKKGEVRIGRQNPDTDAKFCIVIDKFTARGPSKSIDLEVRNSYDEKLATISDLKVIGAVPKIKEFAAAKYILKGDETKLLWVIEPAGGYQLRRLDDQHILKTGDEGKGEQVISEGGIYQLEAMVGDSVTDTRSIMLHFSSGTELKSVPCGPASDAPPGSLVCAEILGVYDCNGKLYAVVRDSAAGNRASIWYTQRGFDRKSWLPVVTAAGERVSIPADVASRPGVVFDDRLCFMGGSSYDANCPGFDVGYFHFEAATWVDAGIKKEAWSKPPPEDQGGPAVPFIKARMGHALLASPTGRQLWVIGGYNGDGGALNDIWVYDKDTQEWAPRQLPLWEPRCLFGAAFCGSTVFIAGGFDSPGGYPTYNDIWYCDTSKETDEWNKLGKSLILGTESDEIKQYRGCTLAAMGDQIYAFVSYYKVDQGGDNDVRKIYPSGDGWDIETIKGVGSDWATSKELHPLDCYRFDATVFGGCIFTRRLARAARKDNSLHYLVVL